MTYPFKGDYIYLCFVILFKCCFSSFDMTLLLQHLCCLHGVFRVLFRFCSNSLHESKHSLEALKRILSLYKKCIKLIVFFFNQSKTNKRRSRSRSTRSRSRSRSRGRSPGRRAKTPTKMPTGSRSPGRPPKQPTTPNRSSRPVKREGSATPTRMSARLAAQIKV